MHLSQQYITCCDFFHLNKNKTKNFPSHFGCHPTFPLLFIAKLLCTCSLPFLSSHSFLNPSPPLPWNPYSRLPKTTHIANTNGHFASDLTSQQHPNRAGNSLLLKHFLCLTSMTTLYSSGLPSSYLSGCSSCRGSSRPPWSLNAEIFHNLVLKGPSIRGLRIPYFS